MASFTKVDTLEKDDPIYNLIQAELSEFSIVCYCSMSPTLSTISFLLGGQRSILSLMGCKTDIRFIVKVALIYTYGSCTAL